jgi:2-methylcitrate dehydratase PrpD
MEATRTLAAFVSNLSFSQLSEEVIQKAKGVILDTLGCAIAGYTLAHEEFHWIYDLVRESIFPKGHPQNPMSEEEVKEKFRRLALYTLTKGQIDKIIKIVDNLENISQPGELTDCLSGVSSIAQKA